MPPICKIAVIQLYVKPLKPEDNFARAVKFIREAAAQGCQLAVLPEFHLTNWIPTDPRFASISLENVTFFISNTGEILGTYIKNLWAGTERAYLRSSSAPHQVIQTPLGPGGLLICWDLAFPEAWRELTSAGAKIIIVPTMWMRNGASEAGQAQNPSAPSLFVDSILTACTFENTCAVVFANAGGPPGKSYCGLSQINIPYAGPLVRLGTSTEGMGVATLDMAVMEDAEKNYGIRADMADPDWCYRHTLRDTGDVAKGKL
ncbi:hypothetical protein N7486_005858 [Penicillium sp. IBT 16267x]|nr:hypothetical protein N7486_005858 [Penicillium sp. IBT 16267x]